MSQLITDPAEFNDWLRELIAHIHWDEFSKLNNGTIELQGIQFKLRVGLHLGRPTQVIIAEGQFIRMRAAPEYADHELKVLDAKNPDNCLYEQLTAEIAEVDKPWLVRSEWKPNEWSHRIWNRFRNLGSWVKGKVIKDDPTTS